MPTPTVDVASPEQLTSALSEVRHRTRAGGGALILIGGADFTGAEDALLQPFFERLARHCERTSTAVVDGGTDSGVMRRMADARTGCGGTFELVGVAPVGAFDRETRVGAPIEPAHGHSLILRVPGERFGDETPWLFAAADYLHGGLAPSILVNGGDLARTEALARLGMEALVLVVEGSGRAADELAARLEGDEGLRASGRLRTIPISTNEAGLARELAG